jgi:ubiquitin-like-conjugating enzyme ATG3
LITTYHRFAITHFITMQYIRSTLNTVRDKYTPARHHSNFRESGQLSPEEFLAAGDYLVYKFPSWSWSDAANPSQRAAHLPEGKQFLVTRAVPCRRRLGGQDLSNAGDMQDVLVTGLADAGEEEWVSTGETSGAAKLQDRTSEVRSVENSARLEDMEEEDEIPDMDDDDDDDEAIIRDGKQDGTNDEYVTPTLYSHFSTNQTPSSLRTYNLYIMYSPYYRTPRLYLSGYTTSSNPLPPEQMMEDIVGDYKDKTVTLEPFPFVDSGLRMASIHPCRHAAVMKILLDRADAALKLRVAKVKAGQLQGNEIISGMEGLEISPRATSALKSEPSSASQDSKKEGEEWEVLQESEGDEDDIAIRVDQYLVVFLKFMASVTPGIEHDFTMGV